jgi:hypothetical protein
MWNKECLITIPSNFALEYTTKKLQKTKEWTKLSGAHQLLYYAYDDNLLHEKVS